MNDTSEVGDDKNDEKPFGTIDPSHPPGTSNE